MGVVELLLAVVFVVCIGGGFAMTPGAVTGGEFWLARICFIVAAISLCSAYFYWVHEGNQALAMRIILGVVVGLLSIVGTTEALQWINRKEGVLNSGEIATRQRLYRQFMEEKTRRVNIYDLCIVYEQIIQGNTAQIGMEGSKKDKINFKEEAQRAEDKFVQLIKDKKEEEARFVGLISEIKLHFKDSSEFQELLRRALNPERFSKVERPTHDDMRTDQTWGSWTERTNATRKEYIANKIQSPLDDLGDYLKSNIAGYPANSNPKPTSTAPPPVIQLPSVGNLKERAIALSEDIMEDLYRRGWRQEPGKPEKSKKSPPAMANRMPLPNDIEGTVRWVEARSGYFKFKFLKKVIDLRNELEQLHLKNEELDMILKAQGMIEDDNKIVVDKDSPLPSNIRILPMEIERISEKLKTLAEQIK